MNTPNPLNDSNHNHPALPREREGAGQTHQKPHASFSSAGSIQYRYALDESDTTIDIRSLKHSHGRLFRCVACGEPLIARLGDQVAHHFAHKANSQCSGETYLHRLAKRVFQEEFKRCQAQRKPFLIELFQRQFCNHHGQISADICQTRPMLLAYDLVPDVTELHVEKRSGDFVPDITLAGKTDIWIEFLVSHECSADKLASTNRIIEIHIRSEADVELFRQHRLSADDSRVKFFNFRDKVGSDLCQWYKHCRLGKRMFLLYSNGSLEVRYERKQAQLAKYVSEKVVWSTEEFIHKGDEPSAQWMHDDLLREAALRFDDAARAAGHTIRSCDLCQHFDRSGEAGCLKHKTPVPWNAATQCEDFAQVNFNPHEDVDE